MKKILSFIVAASALAILLCSCNKDDYGTYEFITNTIVNVSSQERASKIIESIYSDSYFSQKHSYTAKYSDAVNLAANEFDTHIKALDEEFIESQLVFGESVSISLWSMNPAQRWLTYVITTDGVTSESN